MNSNIGAFIAKLRREQGITQSALADKLNISNRTVSKWENGDGLPDISLLPEIARIFGVSVDELLSGEKKEEKAIRVEEVANENNLLNIFHICFIISVFACAFGALLGGFNEVYCTVTFITLFYTHWEIIFAAVSFVAVVFGNLLFYISAVRLNVIYDKNKIISLVYKKAIVLFMLSYVFISTFLVRIIDHYLRNKTAEFTALAIATLIVIALCFLIAGKIKKDS